MRRIILFSLLISIFLINCEEPLTTSENNKIVFRTEYNSYSITDSIKVIIENNTNSKYEIWLRCGSFLEMFYQKKENDIWSKNLWFTWEFVKCVSIPKDINGQKSFEFIIPSNEINAEGTFRLILANDTLIVSNSFEIK